MSKAGILSAALAPLYLALGAVACLTPFAWLAPVPALACTDFLVKSKDGAKIVGRSMEWGLDLRSSIWQHARGESRSSASPDGKPGLSWKSKYGYIGIDGYDMPIAIDGMNEKGLSMGLLWMPGSVYQKVESPQSALSLVDLGHWVLGNFSSVEEVKEALAKVQVWAPSLADWGGQPTAHLAIHDAKGASIVVEFTAGQQKVFDNPDGVLTNAPTFDWHCTNLRNYIKLSAAKPEPLTVGSSVLAAPGQGGGFLGIPGDWTPPSRFVRTSAMLAFAKAANNATEGVNLAEHLLNAVDIPLGDVRENDNAFNHSDYTQWIVIKDLTNSVLYYRSYDNLTLRAIDMKKIDFSQGLAPKKITAIAGGASFVETIPENKGK